MQAQNAGAVLWLLDVLTEQEDHFTWRAVLADGTLAIVKALHVGVGRTITSR